MLSVGIRSALRHPDAVRGLIIPSNDEVDSSASGLAAHRLVPSSRLHRLEVEDQDIP